MKKYLLVAGLGLLTTVAVTATVLSTTEPKKKAVKKEVKKVEKKKECTRTKSNCFFS
jgi:predicted small secreted protein